LALYAAGIRDKKNMNVNQNIVILKKYSESDDCSRYINEVARLADQNKQSFGFNPLKVYEEMSLKEQLWIAINDDKDVCGYIMFGGKYPSLRVFQLFVIKEYRGGGIASLLLNELIEHGNLNRYSIITAKVAQELSANKFWQKNEFFITHTYLGGSASSKKRRTLNHRLFQLNTPDLLSPISTLTNAPLKYTNRPMLSTPIYSLDLNVVFDLIKDRNNMKEARDLITRSMNGAIDIVITPEFVTELERALINEHDPLLDLARALPSLPKFKEEEISGLAESLRKLVFPQRSKERKNSDNDVSDLRHLAYSILAKVTGFVTGERSLLRSSSKLQKEYGIEVLSVKEFSHSPGSPKVLPASIDGNIIKIKPCREYIQLDKIPYFEQFKIPTESIVAIEKQLKKNKFFEVSLLEVDDENIAYYGVNCANNLEKIELYLFVNELHSHAILAIDHFLEESLRRLPNNKICRLDLHISPSQTITSKTAVTKGFKHTSTNNILTKIAYNGILDKHCWPEFVSNYQNKSGYEIKEKFPSCADILNTGIVLEKEEDYFAKPLSLFDFESLISPGLLNHQKRKCTLIPIREDYADNLLGNTSRQRSLFANKANFLMLEKAYFRSPTRASYIQKGSLIAFYVSGSKSVQAIIGIGRVTYSEVINRDQINASLSRQGVISDHKLNEIAEKHGGIHVFTFDNFKKLPKHIGLKKAKQIGLISNANLATIEQLSNDKLSLLLEVGYKE